MKQLLLLCLLLSAPLFGQSYSLFETPNQHDYLIELEWGEQVWIKEQPQGKRQLFHLNGQPVFKQTFDQIWPSNFKGYLELQDGDKFYIGSLEGELWPLARTIDELGPEIKALDFSAKSLGPVDYREISFLLGLPSQLLEQEQIELLNISIKNSRLHREIGQLKNLRILSLTYGRLQQLHKALGQLTKLEELCLSFNMFHNIPEELALAPKLHTLYLDQSPIDSLPDDLSVLSKIKRLSLARRSCTKLAPLAQLKQLKALNLEYTNPYKYRQIEHHPKAFEALAQLSELEYLNLGASVEDSISLDFLIPLQQLRYLNLSSIKSKKILADSLWPQLEQLILDKTNLQWDNQAWKKLFYFSANAGYTPKKLPKAAIEKLPHQLLILELQSRIFSSQDAQALSQFKDLEYLDLEQSQIEALPEDFGQLSKLCQLNLDQCQLKRLPSSFGQLQMLSGLQLSKNQLKELPANFYELQKLQYLNLEGNQLSSLAPEIGQFKELKLLILAHNQLKELPSTISNCKKITYLNIQDNLVRQIQFNLEKMKQLTLLNLSDNLLQALPSSIFQAKKLQFLQLDNNRDLQQLSPKIGQLQNLKTLWLNHCSIQKIPENIGQLTQLQELYLSNNQLQDLPITIGQLTQLQKLHLNNNQLQSLPENIGQLKALKTLTLNNNQLKSLPKSIVQLTLLTDLELRNNKEFKAFPKGFEQLQPKLQLLPLFGTGLSKEEKLRWEKKWRYQQYNLY
ncbi:leucine-rich repeat (LRR) protein [Saprospira grandis DSM 2844]|uniref:Leucine-rich repeat (LRR) protein n=1 Tax=Saprospira grandis DSM 2844 TaxID=694433 RepID=J0Y0G0_9BACT|nr:leucine-rich repeat domain-containing protein [Saprospira grandis]EJF55016.1 leucine-rich repeat (LRR) protein [Saprospira grandis DSM 2844]